MKKVRIVIPDMNGCLRGKIIPRTMFEKNKTVKMPRSVMSQDIEGEESPVLQEFAPSYHDRDIQLTYDKDASYISHLSPEIETFMADFQEKDGTNHNIAPRTILKKAISNLANIGYTMQCATEIEFYLTDFEGNILHGSDLDAPFGDINSINSLQPLLDDLEKITSAIGLTTEAILNEAGAGQFEITFKSDVPLSMADKTMFFKQALRETAKQYDMAVSFLAKHDVDNVSSSQHLHMSLWKDNVQVSAEDSALLESFIAGMINRSLESFALYCPNPNSFRRYVLGKDYVAEGPTFGEDNRRSSFRITGEKGNQHVENRIPGADANPYLILAASIYAGIEGIQQKLSLENSSVLKESEKEFPMGLHDALNQFKSSTFIKDNFGEDFQTLYFGIKSQELTRFNQQITAWEMQTFGKQV